MALTPEKKVKNQVVAILKAAEAYYFYPVTSGFGASGTPDIIVCYYGMFIGIECKAGKNTLSALQRQNIERINKAAGITLAINEDNIRDVYETLERIRKFRVAQDDVVQGVQYDAPASQLQNQGGGL